MTPLQAVRHPQLLSVHRLASRLDCVPSARRLAIVVGHDILAAAASAVVAVYLRLGTHGIGAATTEFLLFGVPLFALLFLTTMLYFRMNQSFWRYTSSVELMTVCKVVTISIVVFYFLFFTLQRGEGVPRSVPVIQWFVLVFALGGSRFAYRLLRNDADGGRRSFAKGTPDRQTPVLLLGATSASSSFIRTVHHSPNHAYHVVGILDLDGAARGRSLHNVRVLGTFDDLEGVIDALHKRGLKPVRLVVTDSLPPDVTANLLERANALGMVLCRMPAPVDFAATEATGNLDLKPVALEDLLGRPQAVLDQEAIDRLLIGRRVMITGAGGSIGAELVRQIARREPAELTLLDHSEFNLYSIDREIADNHPTLQREALLCDVRSRSRVMRIFERVRPEIVFHAAALKHVPMVELNPCEGVLTNAIGTRNVADAARMCAAQAFVQVSTDKAVNPTNVMGASKRLAEFYVQALDLAAVDREVESLAEEHLEATSRNVGSADKKHLENLRRGSDISDAARRTGFMMPRTRFMTVRFGNVLGSSGSVVPLFQQQLQRGGPLTVTHPEIERYFMTIREAVSLVLQASAYGIDRDDERGRIFVLDMGKPVKIIDIARQMIRLAGFKPEVDIRVEITGLRPGEKLYEELFDGAEARGPAIISGVFIAMPQAVPLTVLSKTLDALATLCDRGDASGVREVIADVVPGYASAAKAGHGSWAA